MTAVTVSDDGPRCGHQSEILPHMFCAAPAGHPPKEHYYRASNGSYVPDRHDSKDGS